MHLADAGDVGERREDASVADLAVLGQHRRAFHAAELERDLLTAHLCEREARRIALDDDSTSLHGSAYPPEKLVEKGTHTGVALKGVLNR